MKNFLLLILSIVSVAPSWAQTFQQRQAQYIDSVVANSYDDALIIQAYLDQPLAENYLDTIFNQFGARSTIDFKLVELIRIMYLTDGSYDQEILSQMETLPYWINNGDTLHNYWTENHMIMWMSSEWLLHERFGIEVDENLEQRLLHYLNLKLEVGFYEFFSSTYFPFTVSGLMNLADFATNTEIRDKAEAVVRKLFRDVMLVSNSEGAYYPAAGRNYAGRYFLPYGQNHSAIIYLISGKGPCPSQRSDRADFLATSSIDFSDLESEFMNQVDTIYSFGHSPEEALTKHDSLYYVDELMIQWSSGMYFHPYLAEHTAQLLADSNFWGHVDFVDFSVISGFPISQSTTIATELDELTVSRTDCGADVAIFKNDGVVLTSLQDYWKGKIGFQQWPIAANIGGTAVYTASGEVDPIWENRNNSNYNEHLPYIAQDGNVALVMYRPQEVSPVLPFNNKDVALHWIDSDFDEIDESGNWLFGNKNENYIAVRRACVGEINGVRACETDAGQTWVFIVGNTDMYSSYSNFQNVVGQASFSENWTTNMEGDSTYYASVTFEGNTIEYYWGPAEPFTGIQETEKGSLKVYPNPTRDILNISFPNMESKVAMLDVYDLAGNIIHQTRVSETNSQVDIEQFSSGTYFLRIVDGSKVWTSRFVKVP